MFIGESQFRIERIGPQGDGTSSGARPIYIERSAPGDHVKARLFKARDGQLRAEVTAVLTPSPYRTTAPCEHYDECGGCTLQHLKLEYYRRWKTELVRETFQKVGLRPRTWLPPVFLAEQTRRRVTFTAYKKQGRVLVGYYRRRSQEISEIRSCLISDPKLFALREKIKPLLKKLLNEGEKVDLSLQLIEEKTDLLITGRKKNWKEFASVTEISRISYRAEEEAKIEILFTREKILSHFGKLAVSLPPAAFLQPSLAGERALVGAVTAAIPNGGKIADLFSGCGTFTGPLLEKGTVDAYESNAKAMQALNSSKSFSLKTFRRDLFKNPLRREELSRYDVIVFDPPRAGCLRQAEEMARAKTTLLVGVSCNPATFARDAKILCEGGYWLQSLQVVDQFLWSHHVEVVGVFTRKKVGNRHA